MDTPAPAPPEPPALRVLRIALLGILAISAALLLSLVLATYSAALRYGISDLLGVPFSSHHFRGVSEVTIAAILVGPVLVMATGFLFLAWALRQTSWRRVALGYAVLAGILSFLARDEPAFTHPFTFLSPAEATPEARESFSLFMRYGRHEALGRDFQEPTFTEPYPKWNAVETATWRADVLAHRADFASHASALAPALAWWRDLDRFSQIGDLTPPDPESDIPAFQVLRALSHQALGAASLLAIDGRGDEAVDTVLPLLTVSLKLQPDSRTLVRTMIAIVIERLSLETTGFILDTAPVSPAARARLLAAVKGGDPVPGARRLVGGFDYAFMQVSLGSKSAGELFTYYDSRSTHPWLRAVMNAASPVLYNPKATFNAYGRLVGDQQDLAATRDYAGMEARNAAFLATDAAPRPKNFIGRLMLRSMVPAYVNVTKNYWRTEDLRAALTKRLEAPAAITGSRP